ncbi:MAG: IPT/TIG domain-containing protein [Myxococcota bacterium]
MSSFFVLLWACSTEPPFVSRIAPAQGQPGDAVTLHGSHLSADYTYTLGGKPLMVGAVDESTVSATIAEGAASGPANLIISGSGVDLKLQGLFTVTEPLPDDPCDPSVRRMTHIPSTAEVVKIDLYRGEDVERKQISTRTIERVEFEAIVDADGQYCSSIWLKTDAQRILFDADRAQSLRDQARKIANGLNKPIEIVREDPMPPPDVAE